ncbi:QacE family quaternary ammonium compound efflux SMR transporter [Polynucleobacter sp. TSB-Sco08W16]|jgi:small multidrug resistance pump|uniref:DMT family transporter n=1 Tax=Polynucleobacter sp. TSB-Sco08W16 TaxID=1758374 RepID=UPI001BFD6B81|nr:SMR family transporter [Polynucleobacter sp. TSB-Sco08W16]QWD74244.1 QacE family quaternary ammonium compound efflux SMR transporter [Polynucleobacter sp. TSB-Sco08W16]
MVWLYLAIAIAAEVMATTALKFSEGFTRLMPSLLVVLGYAGAFYFLSKVLNQLPISVAYAIWSGAGVALVGIVGWIWLGQKLDMGALAGIGLIISGVLVINLFSNTVSH